MGLRGKFKSVEEIHIRGSVTEGFLPVFEQVPELAQQNSASVIPLQLDPDTKPHLERDESFLPDTCSAHFAVRFEAP